VWCQDEAEARAALEAVDGVTWTPLQRADLPDVAAFRVLCEEHDDDTERTSLTGLVEYVDSARSRPQADVLVGRGGDGTLVALAWAGCNRARTDRRTVALRGAVHPTHRGRGIGRAVMTWQVAHAAAWDRATREPGHGPLVLRLQVPQGHAAARALAERFGIGVVRYFVDMARPTTPLEVRPARGVRITGWDPARSARAHRVIDEAFADHWGHFTHTEEMWAELTTSHAFRPDWSVLAVDEQSDEVVGVALNCAYPQDWEATGITQGYTDMLGVLRSHRGRGVAPALLAASVARFAASGMDRAGLDVDVVNPSGALGLYERLGYVRESVSCVHELELPRGAPVLLG